MGRVNGNLAHIRLFSVGHSYPVKHESSEKPCSWRMTLEYLGDSTWRKERLSIPRTLVIKKRIMKILLALAVYNMPAL